MDHKLIILMMLTPGITLIMAIPFLGEMPSPIAWVGIGMVLSAGLVRLAERVFH
jgi:drug/metabolite transporter (DMT)-like permease